jgi:hypothetical protein
VRVHDLCNISVSHSRQEDVPDPFPRRFLLFLIYTWICRTLSLLLLGYSYFFCTNKACTFPLVTTQLIRIITLLSIGAYLFTSSVLMNVIYGIITGIGTIDRLKKKATVTVNDSDEDSIPFSHIFGIGPTYTHFLPYDPTFHDIMMYSTPQRYLREQMRSSTNSNSNSNSNSIGGIDGIGGSSIRNNDGIVGENIVLPNRSTTMTMTTTRNTTTLTNNSTNKNRRLTTNNTNNNDDDSSYTNSNPIIRKRCCPNSVVEESIWVELTTTRRTWCVLRIIIIHRMVQSLVRTRTVMVEHPGRWPPRNNNCIILFFVPRSFFMSLGFAFCFMGAL